MEYLWIGIGGFLGANARYIASREILQRVGAGFPYGTLVVNVTGAFLIGIIVTILANRGISDPTVRQLVVVGFLGGYTTFSTYTMEAVSMIQDGRWGSALAYIAGSNVIGLLACAAGIWLANTAGG